MALPVKKTDYTKMTPDQVANQSKYLNNLWATDPNKKSWAAAELKNLSETANKGIVYSSDLGRKKPASTPTTKITEEATPVQDTNLSDLYGTLLNGQIDAVNAGTNATVSEALYQKSQVKPMYDSARGSAYVGGRLSAIGNNEQLANQGLSGALYSAPTSGTSETSRVAQNISMQQAINSFTKDEKDALNTLDREILKAKTAGNVEIARLASENKAQLQQALIAKKEKDFQEEVANIGRYSNNYMAEMQRRGKDDPLYGYLEDARNKKIVANLTAQSEAAQQDWENNFKMLQETNDQKNENARIAISRASQSKSGKTIGNTGKTYQELYQDAVKAIPSEFGTPVDYDAVEEYIQRAIGANPMVYGMQGSAVNLSQIKNAIINAGTDAAAQRLLDMYAPYLSQGQFDYITAQ
jgi:hypothetical protein